MDINVKVTHEENHFIATIPRPGTSHSGGRAERSRCVELFERFYMEARQKKISEHKICEYIGDRIMQECDIEDWLFEDDIKKLFKRTKLNIHKRIRRYKQKLYWLDPNYYVTFTYSDRKETRESFEARLKKTLSNFKERHGWLCMVVPEEGAKNGRLHFHCFLKIPENGMVGELFLNSAFSSKRRKREYFTDNTYFNARFGQSDWHKISREDLQGNGLESYLTKYLSKSGNKIFYSRGIPTEIYMVIDTEKDVFCTYYDAAWKMILFDAAVIAPEANETENTLFLDRIFGFDQSDHYLRYTDRRKLAWANAAA